MNKNHIVVAGSILVDEINTVSKYPPEGELTQISSVSKAVGGCVPNVAVDLKKIMPELKVSAIGKIGQDENATFVKSILENNGVGTDMLTFSQDKTSFTQVISVSGGQRTFFTYPGASADFGKDDIDFESLNVDIFHLGYFLLLQKVDNGDGLKILKKVKERGIKTSIDLVSDNSDRYGCVLPCLPFTDYLIINELEAGRLTGLSPDIKNVPDMAKKLIDLGVNEKVIIHFSSGSVCADKNGNIILNPIYDKIKKLGEYILVKRNRMYGVLDFEGKNVSEIQYKSIKIERNTLKGLNERGVWVEIKQ